MKLIFQGVKEIKLTRANPLQVDYFFGDWRYKKGRRRYCQSEKSTGNISTKEENNTTKKTMITEIITSGSDAIDGSFKNARGMILKVPSDVTAEDLARYKRFLKEIQPDRTKVYIIAPNAKVKNSIFDGAETDAVFIDYTASSSSTAQSFAAFLERNGVHHTGSSSSMEKSS